MVVDLFLVYQFIRRLATPFNKWEAYKLGIIDENGKVLIKRKDFTRAEQRRAWGVFDIMIANLKKLLAKIPGGSSRLASYAAALFLIREWNHFSKDSLLIEDITEEQINESLLLFNDRYVNYIQLAENVNKKINTKPELDEEPANNVGSGNIAGLGVGPQGEPGFSRSAQKKWTSQNKSKKKKLRDIMGDKI
jgi:hypothetical protein